MLSSCLSTFFRHSFAFTILFFRINFVTLSPFSASLDFYFLYKVPFFIAFSLFLINRAPPPFLGLSDREKSGKYAGDSSKVTQPTTRIFRRLHASDPVISRVKATFARFTQFHRSLICTYTYIVNIQEIHNNIYIKTPRMYMCNCCNSI